MRGAGGRRVAPLVRKAYLKKARKARTAQPSKALTRIVKGIVIRQAETKYVADRFDLVDVSDNLIVPTGLYGALPSLGQGVKSNQRIGQKINASHGRVDLSFWLNPGTGSENTASQDVKIKLFMLRPKHITSQSLVPQLENDTLLDFGDQTTTDWKPLSYTAKELNQMPLSKEDFTGRTHTIHLRRNFGQANGGTEAGVLTYGQIGVDYSFTWKHKGNLLYDDKSDVPTNYCPLFGFVAYNNDDSKYNGQVQCRITQHMWFKDA